jgi:3-phosphoglycerate kinase
MTIEQFNFAGKKAIVRVDFNVPLDENGNVTDDTRIRGALPTLKKILADGGALIMMSHMGKPKGKVKPRLKLLSQARHCFLRTFVTIQKRKVSQLVLKRVLLNLMRLRKK